MRKTLFTYVSTKEAKVKLITKANKSEDYWKYLRFK